jgi:hypothetical protein
LENAEGSQPAGISHVPSKAPKPLAGLAKGGALAD